MSQKDYFWGQKKFIFGVRKSLFLRSDNFLFSGLEKVYFWSRKKFIFYVGKSLFWGLKKVYFWGRKKFIFGVRNSLFLESEKVYYWGRNKFIFGVGKSLFLGLGEILTQWLHGCPPPSSKAWNSQGMWGVGRDSALLRRSWRRLRSHTVKIAER